MVLHTRQTRKGLGSFIRDLSNLIVFWTSFGGTFGKIGRIFGNSDCAGKTTNLIHTTLCLLFSCSILVIVLS
jgi:hypothetical protein